MAGDPAALWWLRALRIWLLTVESPLYCILGEINEWASISEFLLGPAKKSPDLLNGGALGDSLSIYEAMVSTA